MLAYVIFYYFLLYLSSCIAFNIPSMLENYSSELF